MKKLQVVKVTSEFIKFNDGTKLSSFHESECCEHHYLCFGDLTIKDFEDLSFNLSSKKFFRKIGDYGIELVPVKGHTIKIPGYGYNNGYYSDELILILEDKNDNIIKRYDITECQVVTEESE